jgi:phosphohistidine phosphatase
MKTLLLLRHAKSNWDDPSLRDFDRPLNERGLRDAPKMGKALSKRGPVPDLIISSPAARARATVQAVAAAAAPAIEIQFEDSIYGASLPEMLRLVRRLPDSSSCSMLVGHNPTFEELLSLLTGSPTTMPTCALGCIEFRVEQWSDVESGRGKLTWFLTPKSI